ncbi:MAG TPA: tripartite tricarboxylate transporter TctB family protein, partial [Casimicrobiaceae bacterium]|nr:tripartite tricarboxylate transporter TctB family protein [Casimicrobiaceae bacterium]
DGGAMSGSQRRLHKDFWGGSGIALFGVVYGVQGARYTIGSLSRMGPGYFPVALGVILALTGIAIAIIGYRKSVQVEGEHRPAQWRAWALISVSIVAFVLVAERFGLVPAAFAIVFISALADRDNDWKRSAVLGAAIVVVAIVVFWWALQIQLPLLQWRS